MKTLITCALALSLTTGCVIANRSVVSNTLQKSTTEGQVSNSPKWGNPTIDAPKTTEDSWKPATSASVANTAQTVDNKSTTQNPTSEKTE